MLAVVDHEAHIYGGDVMPGVDVPDYTPGAPWKAVIMRTPDGGLDVHLWGVGADAAPHHADVIIQGGLSFEDVCAYAWSVDPEGIRADVNVLPSCERTAVESVLRDRIPDVELGAEDDPWTFG